MQIIIRSQLYRFQTGLLVIVNLSDVPGSEPSELSASIEGGVAEVAVSVAGTFLVFIANCHIVRLSDHIQLKVPRLSVESVNINSEDIRDGTVKLDLTLREPLRITVKDDQGRPMTRTKILLVNTEQCQEVTTDDQGEVIVFEKPDAYRIVVPDHPRVRATTQKI